MMGMTPDIFTLMGMVVDWPPYIFRPTTRLAYWTGIFRSDREIKTINTRIRHMPMRNTGMSAGWSTMALSPLTSFAQFFAPVYI